MNTEVSGIGNVNLWIKKSLMIEEILPDLYGMELPRPGSPLRALNSLALIIETQLCPQAMCAGLAKSAVTPVPPDI